MDESNWTPLHEAVNEGNVGCVAKLLLAGANVNSQDIDANTPLHKAAENGDVECAALLVAKGASLEIRNDCKMTPSDCAVLSESEDCIIFLRTAQTELRNRLEKIAIEKQEELMKEEEEEKRALLEKRENRLKKEKEKKLKKRIVKQQQKNGEKKRESKPPKVEEEKQTKKDKDKDKKIISKKIQKEDEIETELDIDSSPFYQDLSKGNDDMDKMILRFQLDAAQQSIVMMEKELAKEKQKNRERKEHKPQVVESLRSLNELAARIEEVERKASQLEQEIQQERMKTRCINCYIAERDTILMPCLHFLYCGECIKNFKGNNSDSSKCCPACSLPIGGMLICKMK